MNIRLIAYHIAHNQLINNNNNLFEVVPNGTYIKLVMHLPYQITFVITPVKYLKKRVS